MKNTLIKILKCTVTLLPAVIGMIGFHQTDLSFSDCAYSTLKMYLLDYDGECSNILINIARWTAPLVTASGIILLWNHIRIWIRNTYLYMTKKGIAIYDPHSSDLGIMLQKQLHKTAITCDENAPLANRYVLLGSESENISFYEKNRTYLEQHPVYMKCNTIPSYSVVGTNVKLFNPEEICARQFWKELFPYEQVLKKRENFHIVLIGFDSMGQMLLSSALQLLIYHVDQKISYHVFGDNSGYLNRFPYLDQIEDAIHFYDCPWHEKRALIDSADLVLVSQEKDTFLLVNQLLLSLTREQLYVFSDGTINMNLLDEHNRVVIVEKNAYINSMDDISKDTLATLAKKINLRYANIYSQVEETSENMEIEWKKLNSFTRYSNINAADYHEVRLKMVAYRNLPDNPQAWAADVLDEFAELEHIRWMRYHYLNNWHYGIPSSKKAKDPIHRIHSCLVPYCKLPEPEKEKDRENIRLLFRLLNKHSS